MSPFIVTHNIDGVMVMATGFVCLPSERTMKIHRWLSHLKIAGNSIAAHRLSGDFKNRHATLAAHNANKWYIHWDVKRQASCSRPSAYQCLVRTLISCPKIHMSCTQLTITGLKLTDTSEIKTMASTNSISKLNRTSCGCVCALFVSVCRLCWTLLSMLLSLLFFFRWLLMSPIWFNFGSIGLHFAPFPSFCSPLSSISYRFCCAELFVSSSCRVSDCLLPRWFDSIKINQLGSTCI